ncbi:hypothetical protein FD755_015993 [Muntiacus reevesi]|uniref:PNPLA domain-containing protein n=1 Tax=Muntiacus reevesi TaxID=9886 RepID=A0A5N3XE46_MUNRE|nr:hypothetical protein FD755_015993 [Muntiacus reevesi]
MPHINLSFAACGFLGVYHLGAASALCKHGRKLLKDVKAFAGASAGSLVASVLLTAPQKIEECNKFTCDFAEEIRRQSLGALTPGYDFMARLRYAAPFLSSRSGVESILPANAHELAHDRLHVSITNTRTGRNCLVCLFPSREHLIQPVSAGVRADHRERAGVSMSTSKSGTICPLHPSPTSRSISLFSVSLSVSFCSVSSFIVCDAPPGVPIASANPGLLTFSLEYSLSFLPFGADAFLSTHTWKLVENS